MPLLRPASYGPAAAARGALSQGMVVDDAPPCMVGSGKGPYAPSDLHIRIGHDGLHEYTDKVHADSKRVEEWQTKAGLWAPMGSMLQQQHNLCVIRL